MDCVVRVRGPWARLEGPPEARAAAREALTAEVPGARHTRAYQSGRWDGTRCLVSASGAFPSGLAERVANAVGARVAFEDANTTLAPLGVALAGIELRPYQVAGADVAVERRRILVECPTGSGKTEIGAEVIRRVGAPALWLTHRADLAHQTAERLRARLGAEIGRVGAGAADWRAVTVGMVPTLARRLKSRHAGTVAHLEAVRVLVLDEAHHGAADTWAAVAAACASAAYRIGLSGTAPRRDPLTDLLLEGVCGPTLVAAETGALEAAGFLARPTVRLLEPPPASYPSYEEVREAVLPDWRRDPKRLARLGTRLFDEARRRGIVGNRDRTEAFAAAAARHALAGERVLVLCELRPHAAALEAAVRRRGVERTWCLTGEDKDREAALGRYRLLAGGGVLVATPWFREGMDVPEIDAGLLAGGSLSEIAVLQGFGRMLRPRPDKAEVLVYDALDGRDPGVRKDYLAQHALARLRVYRERGWAVERQPAGGWR